MNIINQTVKFLNHSVLPMISKRHQHLFRFGIQAFTLQSFTSLNGNARTLVANRKTAESNVFRLMHNQSMPEYFTQLIGTLHLVKPIDTVNIDFSSFCGFEVLTFAKQTQLGRAIPLYFELIRYPIVDPGSQTLFIISAIKQFKKVLGFCPKLVFDRGFELPRLITYLSSTPFFKNGFCDFLFELVG